jgi:AcrR family transcriptional regulator
MAGPFTDRSDALSTDRRSETRRAELLDAADRVISRHGPDASMSAIAAEAGITKPILYRHFGDKGGLYRALAERYVAPLREQLQHSIRSAPTRYDRLVAAIDTYLRFIEHYPQTYSFLMHRALAEQPEAHTTVAAFIRVIGREVAGVLRTEYARSVDVVEGADAWGHGIVGMVQVAGDWWLEERTVTREQMVDSLARLLWSGLAVYDAAEDSSEETA